MFASSAFEVSTDCSKESWTTTTTASLNVGTEVGREGAGVDDVGAKLGFCVGKCVGSNEG